MAYQVTDFVDDLADVAFAIRLFCNCGEPVAWTVETGRAESDGRTQYALFRHDCHVEVKHTHGRSNEPVLVED